MSHSSGSCHNFLCPQYADAGSLHMRMSTETPAACHASNHPPSARCCSSAASSSTSRPSCPSRLFMYHTIPLPATAQCGEISYTASLTLAAFYGHKNTLTSNMAKSHRTNITSRAQHQPRSFTHPVRAAAAEPPPRPPAAPAAPPGCAHAAPRQHGWPSGATAQQTQPAHAQRGTEVDETKQH